MNPIHTELLKNFKELFDEGLVSKHVLCFIDVCCLRHVCWRATTLTSAHCAQITKEEYDAKRKEVLGMSARASQAPAASPATTPTSAARAPASQYQQNPVARVSAQPAATNAAAVGQYQQAPIAANVVAAKANARPHSLTIDREQKKTNKQTNKQIFIFERCF